MEHFSFVIRFLVVGVEKRKIIVVYFFEEWLHSFAIEFFKLYSTVLEDDVEVDEGSFFLCDLVDPVKALEELVFVFEFELIELEFGYFTAEEAFEFIDGPMSRSVEFDLVVA